MPVDYSSHRSGSYVRLTSHGIITDDELLHAIQTMCASDEATRLHRCALMDFSRVERVDVSSDTVRELAQLNINASKLVTPGAAVALAAPQALVYGLGRMWEIYAQNTGWETRVFERLEEAEHWLEERLAAQTADPNAQGKS